MNTEHPTDTALHRLGSGVGAVTTREELRNAIVTGIDSALSGILSRFIGHDAAKLMRAERNLVQGTDDATNAMLDRWLALYFKEP